MTFCTCGYLANSTISRVVTCPLCSADIFVVSKEDAGRAVWLELHTVEHPTPQWYADWLTSIPSFGCDCQGSWARMTADHPPDFDNFAQWAVDRHNDVNRKLGKPQWASENKGT